MILILNQTLVIDPKPYSNYTHNPNLNPDPNSNLLLFTKP